MESIFGPVSISLVNIDPSIINANWPRSEINSDVLSTVNSPCPSVFLSSVELKPKSVFKLFCDNPNSTWENVNIISLRPLTSITKSPEQAVTRNFTNSVPTDMDSCHCFFPKRFNDQVVTCCMGLFEKKPVVCFRSYGNRRRRLFRFITQRKKNFVCFYFIYRYSLLRTLLPLPRRFYRINAAWSPWTRVALSTVYFSTCRRFNLYSSSPRSRRINLGYWFANDFIWMGCRHHYHGADYNSDFGWVYFRCASW